MIEFKKMYRKSIYYIRRGLLGFFKSTTLATWTASIAMLLGLPNKKGVLATLYGLVGLSGLLGGGAEMAIASRKEKTNGKLTSIWNTGVQFFQTLEIKSLSYNMFLLRNFKFSNPPGALSIKWYIILAVFGNAFVSILSGLSGFGEFLKYRYVWKDQKEPAYEEMTLYRKRKHRVKKMIKKGMNISIAGIDAVTTLLAVIEIAGVTVEDVLNKLFLNSKIDDEDIVVSVDKARLYLFPVAALFGLSLGVFTQFRKNKCQRLTNKSFFVLNEFLQSATFCFVACVEFHKIQLFDLLKEHPEVDKYLFTSSAILLTIFSALLHAHDEYKNKYIAPEKRRFIGHIEDQKRRALFRDEITIEELDDVVIEPFPPDKAAKSNFKSFFFSPTLEMKLSESRADSLQNKFIQESSVDRETFLDSEDVGEMSPLLSRKNIRTFMRT